MEMKWQKGTPSEYGQYLVSTNKGNVGVDEFSGYGWEYYNKTEQVIGWCFINNIKPMPIKPIGYQLEVNGEYFDFNGMIFSFQVFETHQHIKDWLNAYGTMCGLDENSYVKVVEIYENDIEDYTYIDNVPRKIDEHCPYCDNDIEIRNKFIPQVCHYCGSIILPCSMCLENECSQCHFQGNKCKSSFFKNWKWDNKNQCYKLTNL